MPGEVVRSVLHQIWEVLEPLGHRQALMGGISLSAWNHIRATQDVDILISLDRSQLDDVIATLRPHGCRPKKDPPLVVVGDHSFVQFWFTPRDEVFEVQFELLLAETPLQRSAMERRVRREVPGLDLPLDVLRPDDLILFKLLAGRIIGRFDAAMLLRENRQSIDFPYLHGWVRSEKFEAEYAEIWREAFPDEPMPVLA